MVQLHRAGPEPPNPLILSHRRLNQGSGIQRGVAFAVTPFVRLGGPDGLLYDQGTCSHLTEDPATCVSE